MIVNDYPEPKEAKQTTLKVECCFTTYVSVYGEDKEDWVRQIKELTQSELLEECDKIKIEDWEEI